MYSSAAASRPISSPRGRDPFERLPEAIRSADRTSALTGRCTLSTTPHARRTARPTAAGASQSERRRKASISPDAGSESVTAHGVPETGAVADRVSGADGEPSSADAGPMHGPGAARQQAANARSGSPNRRRRRAGPVGQRNDCRRLVIPLDGPDEGRDDGPSAATACRTDIISDGFRNLYASIGRIARDRCAVGVGEADRIGQPERPAGRRHRRLPAAIGCPDAIEAGRAHRALQRFEIGQHVARDRDGGELRGPRLLPVNRRAEGQEALPAEHRERRARGEHADARERKDARPQAPAHYSPGGFAPPDPPARSLARRFAGSRRSRGSLTVFARICMPGGLRPAGPPCTLSRSPLAGSRRSRGSLTAFARICMPGGFAPPDPPARSLARRFAGSRRSRGSLTGFARVAMRVRSMHAISWFRARAARGVRVRAGARGACAPR